MSCCCRISVALNKYRPSVRALTTVFVFIAALDSLAANQPPLTHSLTAVTPPESVPTLKLQDMDEEFLDIESLRGKTVVINFWATWCPPCRREMTHLEKLHQATVDNEVVVLAVDVGEEMETVFSFINSIEPSPSFPILFDSDGSTMDRWGVRGLPTTFIISSDGKIVYKAIGGREFDHPDMLDMVAGVSKQDSR